MGAGDMKQTEMYFRKLLKITMIFALIWNGIIFALTPIMINFYVLDFSTARNFDLAVFCFKTIRDFQYLL